MFLFNLIAAVTIVANFVLAICGYMGNYQLIVLFVAFLSILIKQALNLNHPDHPNRRSQTFKNDQDGNNWFDSLIDDYLFSIIALIVISINLAVVLCGLY